MESLQDLVVRRAREIGGNNGALSQRDLEAACKRAVSRGIFQKIMAGEYDATPSQDTLDGIALAIQVPVAVVERAAGAPPSYGPFQVPNGARLNPAQRRAIKHVVEVMLTSSGASESAGKGADVVQLPTAESRARKPAARTRPDPKNRRT